MYIVIKRHREKIAYAILSVMNAVAGVLTLMVIGRSIGVEAYGEFVAVISMVTISYAAASMGVPLYIIHKINARLDQLYVGSFGFVLLSMSTVILVLTGIELYLYEYKALWKYILIALVVVQTSYDMVVAVSQINKNFRNMSVATILFNPTRLLVVLTLYFLGVTSPVSYALALVLPGLANFILFSKVIKKEACDGIGLWALKWQTLLPRLISETFPYAGESLLYIAYFQMATIIINQLCGSNDVAKYAASYSMATSTYIFGGIYFQKIAQVQIMQNVCESKGCLYRSLYTNSLLAFIIGFPMGIFLAVFGDLLVKYIYGSEFIPMNGVFLCIGMTIPVRYMITAITAHMMTPLQTKIKMCVVGVALLFSAILCSVLSSSYGVLGGAISIICTEMFWLVLLWIVWYRVVYRNYESITL